MAKIFDDDGNELELQVDFKDLPSVLEKAQKAEELEKTLKEKEEALAKLNDKDMNFTRFREKTEEEQSKLLEKMGGEKRMMMEEMLALRKESDDVKIARLEAAKEAVLSQEAGDDKDLRKSIELRVKEWGEPKTPEEAFKRYGDASILVKANRPDVTPLNAYMPVSSYNEPIKPKVFTQTQTGKDLYTRMFPDSPIAKEEKK